MIYRFRIAEDRDEASLRKLLAETPMPGDITVTFEHEPDHFRALIPTGLNAQTLIALDSEERIVGMLCRSIGEHYLNGRPHMLSYLGGLRVRPEYRSGTLIARGMEFLRTIEQLDGCRDHFAVIADGNSEALRAFTEQRHRLFPQLTRVCGVRTFGIIVGNSSTHRTADIRTGADIPIDDIIRFLNTCGAKRQFFPVYTKAHFTAYQKCGLRPEDIFVSLKGGAIVGVIAYWDMTSVRQTIVRAYSPFMRAVRPFYNTYLRMTGARVLPGIGGSIDAAYTAFTCIADNDISVYRGLLAAAVTRARVCRKAYLMAGFTENDPLAAAASHYRHVMYRSAVYAAMDTDSLDGRLPYVEIASL